jgi:hypothetical protein
MLLYSIAGVQRGRRWCWPRLRSTWAASPTPATLLLRSLHAIYPGDYESAGQRLSGRLRHGNRWFRTALLQAAWAAIKVKGGYFGAQFRRIAKRRGQKRAATAVAHSILTVIYHLLSRGVFHQDLGAAFLDRHRPNQHTRYQVRGLVELGFTVTLEPGGAA